MCEYVIKNYASEKTEYMCVCVYLRVYVSKWIFSKCILKSWLAERMMTVIKLVPFHHTKLKSSNDISKGAC